MIDNSKPEKVEAGHTFSYTHTGKDGKKVTKKYKTLLGKVVIPHLNDGQPLTSLEISNDEAAQKHIIESNAIGSVVEEIASEENAPAE